MHRVLLGVCVVLLLVGTYCLYVVERGPGVIRVTVVSPSFRVVGPPSVSVTFLNQVLDAYQSPASGQGQALYEDGVAVGIDPVYGLAFFLHESTMGRAGWGAVNHSLGNIRCSAGYACQGGFRSYRTWGEGFADWYQLIAGSVYVGSGLVTVEEIIPRYAPSGDHNDERGYIHAVEMAVQTWRSGSVWVRG